MIPNEMLVLNLWPHRNVEYLICAQLSAAGGRVHSTGTHSMKPPQLNRVEAAERGSPGHHHRGELCAVTPRWFSASPPACHEEVLPALPGLEGGLDTYYYKSHLELFSMLQFGNP